MQRMVEKSRLSTGVGGRAPQTEPKTKKAKMDIDSVRKEHRLTYGAGIVIKNVLPFLRLSTGDFLARWKGAEWSLVSPPNARLILT